MAAPLFDPLDNSDGFITAVAPPVIPVFVLQEIIIFHCMDQQYINTGHARTGGGLQSQF